MIQKPEGTQDMFGEISHEWQWFVYCADSILKETAYNRIEIPTFEKEELFVRGIGDSSDIVNKEMFSVFSGGNVEKLKNGEEIPSKSRFALRPEGTAGIVRAAIENGLIGDAEQPLRVWYAGNMFRAERPQKGRLREFHQFGAECIGSEDAFFEVEMMCFIEDFLRYYGVDPKDLTFHLNTIGCKECRPAWRDAVKKHIEAHANEMCETCRQRAEKNPLRAFDCKEENCKRVMAYAPKIDEFLCLDCRTHFEKVKRLLNTADVEYTLDPLLVRGLDYYTRTVFEVTFDEGLGAQNALGGGGRYDGLVEELGGKSTPGVGFALGFERCLLAKQAEGYVRDKQAGPELFFVLTSDEGKKFYEEYALTPGQYLSGWTERDFRPVAKGEPPYRSIKSQLRLANKLNSQIVVILGDDELREGMATVKVLATHRETKVPIEELKNSSFISKLKMEAWENE